jgi:hypothetical protein
MGLKARSLKLEFWLGTGLACLTVFSFQNCGAKYQPNASLSSNSTQCLAKAKAEALAQKIPAGQLGCDDFNNYSCERRIFSPDLATLSHSLMECIPGSDICVNVEIHQFNTLAAKVGSTPEQFEPGGDYNHEEIHCYHHLLVRGVALFDKSGESLAEALANTMKSCEASEVFR